MTTIQHDQPLHYHLDKLVSIESPSARLTQLLPEFRVVSPPVIKVGGISYSRGGQNGQRADNDLLSGRHISFVKRGSR
jgi:hypothetical protein